MAILAVFFIFLFLLVVVFVVRSTNKKISPVVSPTLLDQISVKEMCEGCDSTCPNDPQYKNNDFFASEAAIAGLDPAKISICDNIFYYDGIFTCIGTYPLDRNLSCDGTDRVCVPDTLGPSCGDSGTYGDTKCALQAVKTAIDDGLDAVKCPRFMAT